MEIRKSVMSDSSLVQALEKMDVPYHRTQTLNKNNLVWLMKHLPERNSERKNFQKVFSEVERRLEEKEFSN